MEEVQYTLEDVWQANETLAEIHARQQESAPPNFDLVRQFSQQRKAYEAVGERVLSRLIEAVPAEAADDLRISVMTALAESHRGEREEEICLRALGGIRKYLTAERTRRKPASTKRHRAAPVQTSQLHPSQEGTSEEAEPAPPPEPAPVAQTKAPAKPAKAPAATPENPEKPTKDAVPTISLTQPSEKPNDAKSAPDDALPRPVRAVVKGQAVIKVRGRLPESSIPRMEELEKASDETLCNLLREDDKLAAHVLLQRYHRFIYKKAHQQLRRQKAARLLDVDDLAQEAAIIFLETAKRWHAGEASLATFMFENIEYRLLQRANELAFLVRVPHNVAQDLVNMNKLDTSRAGKGQKRLTPEEVSAEFDIPVRADEKHRSALVYLRASMLRTFMGSLEGGFGRDYDDDASPASMLDYSKGVRPVEGELPPDPFDEVAGIMLRKKIDEILGTLSEREAGVISMRFGLTDGQPKSLDDVGKVYGVTRERIRQIEIRTMEKLRQPARSHALRDFWGDKKRKDKKSETNETNETSETLDGEA